MWSCSEFFSEGVIARRDMLKRLVKWVSMSVGVMISQLFPLVSTGVAQSTDSRSEQAMKAASSEGLKIDFDHFSTGPAPTDFIQALKGEGKPVLWEIRPEPTARSGQKVLAQTSTEEVDVRSPLLLCSDLATRNVAVSVFFKPVSGKINQTAGIVARYQDQDHFYVVYADALENTVRLYKVNNEIQQPLGSAHTQVATGEWHWMQLAVRDSHFQVSYDGVSLFEAEDNTYKEAGRVGLSTKSDSVTIFDDLYVKTNDQE